MNYAIFLMFFVGIMTKIVDNYHDKKRNTPKPIIIFLAIAYGFIIAFVAKEVPATMSLFLAVILGLIMTGKIDYYGHWVGVTIFFAASYFLGFSPVNFALLAVFIFSGILDEIASDYSEKRAKVVYRVLAYRPFLEITAFSVSAYTGLWEIWLALLAYDIGAGYIPVYKFLRNLI